MRCGLVLTYRLYYFPISYNLYWKEESSCLLCSIYPVVACVFVRVRFAVERRVLRSARGFQLYF